MGPWSGQHSLGEFLTGAWGCAGHSRQDRLELDAPSCLFRESKGQLGGEAGQLAFGITFIRASSVLLVLSLWEGVLGEICPQV
jgi:hypothetical protein